MERSDSRACGIAVGCADSTEGNASLEGPDALLLLLLQVAQVCRVLRSCMCEACRRTQDSRV